jgi:predicted nucleic acid-binding protein
MPDDYKTLYWDTSVLLCFLNPEAESERRAICEDILHHAKAGHVTLHTSTYSIAEVIRPKKHDIPGSRRLSAEEIADIQGMFKWPWLRKIDVDQRVANQAVTFARDYEMSPADSIHAASCFVWKIECLQHWERGGFSKLSGIMNVSNPTRITPQGELMEWRKPIGPGSN